MIVDNASFFCRLFSLEGQTALVTGGSGALGSTLARALAQAGASVVILGRRADPCERLAEEIQSNGGQALGLACDVLDRAALEQVAEEITGVFGPVDLLVNAAGGNSPQATTTNERSFFTLDRDSVAQVVGANFLGTMQTCQVFGRVMAERGNG